MSTDETQLFSLLGLCRKAHKIVFGHDACKIAMRDKTAKCCILCADASERLKAEMLALATENSIPVQESAITMSQMKAATQYASAVFCITEVGFARRIAALQENIS
ncbi:MAG: ribosomal L7Ae/L30e/S12e/Gadd45 family protein [Oscillospiraceae bacterium]|jgi:ribosomal protein L7Ae-like RNA K-turn-binding protein|nr:ribosomal L7Ae/L30e/S12e/Gadd45 family protein [Oscillospiraceae bacterium]